jgi:2-(1,2-epoxy-1,2-dihydrophenyl)acetyl-CoA isomerase
MANEVLTESRGQALVVSFNRPDKGNALNFDMANRIFATLKPATTSLGIRAVLLRGEGGHFMNGLDHGVFAGEYQTALAAGNQLIQPYHSSIREMHTMDKPILAAVEGRVMGPGMSFMLASDLILAARSTVFNMGFTSYALSPDGGASFYLTRKIGAAKAMELLMLSTDFTAEQAQQWGLINGIVDDDKLHDEAKSWVDNLAQGPTKAFGSVKRLVNKAFEQDIITHLGLEHTYWGATTRSFDFRAAIKANFDPKNTKFSGA